MNSEDTIINDNPLTSDRLNLLRTSDMGAESSTPLPENQPSSPTSNMTKETGGRAFEPHFSSSQLSCSSLTAGMDEMEIFSSQDSDILLTDDFETGLLKRKVNDITEEDAPAESHDHDAVGQQPPRKKITTQPPPPSSINSSLPPGIKLSPFSSQKINKNVRKPKTMYKIFMQKKNTNTDSGNSKHQSKSKGQTSNLRDVQSSSKLAIPKKEIKVSNEENSSSQLKPKRGRKKKPVTKDQEKFQPEPNGIFSNLRILFIQNNIDTVRLGLMKEKVIAKGGIVVNTFDANVTHVITALPGKNVHKALGLANSNSLKVH